MLSVPKIENTATITGRAGDHAGRLLDAVRDGLVGAHPAVDASRIRLKMNTW